MTCPKKYDMTINWKAPLFNDGGFFENNSKMNFPPENG
jgi:hypothetical protein